MDELISRQAVLDAMSEEPAAWCDDEYELGMHNQWEADMAAIKAVPSAQPERMCVNCERKEEKQ